MKEEVVPQRCRILAPAKINLFLRVTGKREDGYHDLVTWMHKLTLCDTIDLEFGSGKGVCLHCDDPTLPTGAGNLVIKAVEAFLTALGKKTMPGLVIRLSKKIPVAAGLGGGSSDAGTVLRGLNKMFGTPFSGQHLVEIARNIGADVPFFTTAWPSVIATGIGEVMKPIKPLAGYRVLLVNPGFPVSTAWVFEKFRLTTQSKNSTLSCFKSLDEICSNFSEMSNDLESVTFGKYPEVKEIRDALVEGGADLAMMSGSGPTVFGLFSVTDSQRHDSVSHLARFFRQRFGERVYVTDIDTGA